MPGINTNTAAYYAQSNLTKANNASTLSIGRLSSGNKIVRAADDVAALSIGTGLQTNVTTLRTALNNTAQGSALLQVADGALGEVVSILQRQKAIAVQANSGTLTTAELGFLDQEFQALANEIDRIVSNTNFNGVNLIDGTAGADTANVVTSTTLTSANYGFSGTVPNDLILDGTLTFGAVAGTGAVELQGAFGTFTGVFDPTVAAADDMQINIDFGGKTFSAYYDLSANTANAIETGETLTFLHSDGTNTTSFILTIGSAPTIGIGNQTQVDDFAALLTSSLSGVTFTQSRNLTAATFTAPTAINDGNLLNGVVIANVTLTDSAFDTTDATLGAIGAFTVNSVSSNGAMDASITTTINGSTYTATGLGDASNQLAVASTVTLTNVDNSADTFVISLATLATAIDLIDVNDANALEDALNFTFNVTSGGDATTGLDFQVGTSVTDMMTVSIGDASTNTIYAGAALSVTSSANAVVAVTAIDTAIDTVTSVRADVGALQSRFDFAASNIEVSLQNQDSARGVLLDTDISAESTKFANYQVLMQASISVLAQANQIPQNLLKLIG